MEKITINKKNVNRFWVNNKLQQNLYNIPFIFLKKTTCFWPKFSFPF